MWQITSTNTINCTLVLKRSSNTCKEVWKMTSANTLNCTVMFQHRALNSGIGYMHHCSVAKCFDHHSLGHALCKKLSKDLDQKSLVQALNKMITLYRSHICSAQLKNMSRTVH